MTITSMASKRSGHKYVVEEELGRGGMGVVYRALQVELEREVALKRLLGKMSLKEHQRFKREIQSGFVLRHPNVIKILDCGELDGELYFTMELLQASSLDDLLDKSGPLPTKTILSVATQISEAPQHCHRMGFLHRDIKPSNIMVDENGHVTLMDFGLARGDKQTVLTRQGKRLGTPHYIWLKNRRSR